MVLILRSFGEMLMHGSYNKLSGDINDKTHHCLYAINQNTLSNLINFDSLPMMAPQCMFMYGSSPVKISHIAMPKEKTST